MAYQTRGRDPLLDTNMAEAIEKRGKELLGLGLIALGLMAAMMIGSYTPDDPNFMVSTDAPVQNWLGRVVCRGNPAGLGRTLCSAPRRGTRRGPFDLCPDCCRLVFDLRGNADAGCGLAANP